jgi:antitoxin component of MazEF toxin-antitoxin module
MDIYRISKRGAAMPTAIFGKWGNSLALRIPGEVAASVRLREGDAVEIEAEADRLVIRPAVPRFSAADLFAGQSAAAWRAAYQGAFDWGEDVGREVVPE